MDFLIFKEPLEIREGEKIFPIYPLGVVEYYKNSNLFMVLSVTVNYLLQQIDTKEVKLREHVKKTTKNFDVVSSNATTLNQLIQLLALLSHKDYNDFLIQKSSNNLIYIDIDGFIINRENYDMIRNSIIKANSLKLPKQAATKELQQWFDKTRNYKSKEKGATLTDIATTIVTVTGLTFNDIKDMSIYQINHLIGRINKVKQYEAEVQFISAGASDIKLTNYLEHIADDNEEKLSTSLSEVKKKLGSI